MEKLISEFLDYLKYERNRSECTVENYGTDLRLFQIYAEGLDAEVSWQTVDSDLVRGWMEAMMDKGGSAASVSRRLSSLRSFFRFALARGKVEKDSVRYIKSPKREKALPQYLREEDMDKLLGGDYWGDSFSDVCARAMILTFYSTGVRLSELVGLDDESVDFSSNLLKVLGKRNKERQIPFGGELKRELLKYQKLRNSQVALKSNALFVTCEGSRITPQQVRNEVKRHLSKVTTMKKRSPHVLRHTFATAMLNNESYLESIRVLLGHESVATTEIYTHTTFEQLRNVYGKTHPRGEEEGQSERKKAVEAESDKPE